MELIEVGHYVLKKLNEAGYEAYFVGGMVRDQLLGRNIYDIDVTTSALPDEVQKLFEKTYATGIAHGTVTVVVEKIPVEVTTYRVDSDYLDYRHPQSVSFTSSLDEDLQRRDFTINAIARNIDGELYDPLNGLEDLERKVLRAVGEARVRFTEDPLRILRAIRFVSKLGFTLDTEVYAAIKEQRHLIKHLAKERIKKELEGMMTGTDTDKAIGLLFDTGLLAEFEVFQPLKKYESYSFTNLNQGLDFFVLAGLEVGNLQQFLSEWPFSRQEKKSINLINELIKRPMSKTHIQYRYGVEMAYLYHRIHCFLEQKVEIFVPSQLMIESRKELDIKVADILKETGRKSGPWTGQLLEKIEFEVVSGDLENKKESILDFVRKQGIVDE